MMKANRLVRLVPEKMTKRIAMKIDMPTNITTDIFLFILFYLWPALIAQSTDYIAFIF